MSEMNLRQPGFTFTKNKKKNTKTEKSRRQSLYIRMKTVDIYKNELDKNCFQHDIAY